MEIFIFKVLTIDNRYIIHNRILTTKIVKFNLKLKNMNMGMKHTNIV